jgi:hypothetical protein
LVYLQLGGIRRGGGDTDVSESPASQSHSVSPLSILLIFLLTIFSNCGVFTLALFAGDACHGTFSIQNHGLLACSGSAMMIPVFHLIISTLACVWLWWKATCWKYGILVRVVIVLYLVLVPYYTLPFMLNTRLYPAPY